MAGILTAAVASTFGANADPYFEYTTLLLPGNGTNGAQNNTFLDGSTNNFTITRNGNTTQGTFSPFSQTGWGNYFDGTGDYLSVADNTAFEFGSSEFCIELFAYVTATDSSGTVFAGQWNTPNRGWILGYVNSGSTLNFDYSTNGSNSTSLSVAVTFNLNSWNHIVACRSGNTLSTYLNGFRVGTASMTGVTIFAPNQALEIGRNQEATTLWEMNGYISGLRITKGSSPYDATLTTLTVPTAPLTAISGTSLLTCQSNRFIDNSTNNFTITRNGDTRVVAFSPFNPSASWSAATYGGSGYFDGNGDYLSVASNAAFDIGSNDFQISFWVYTGSSGAQVVFGSPVSSNLEIAINSNQTVYIYNGTTTYTSSNTIQLNAWNYLVFSKVSGTLRIFINGNEGFSGSASNFPSSTNGLNIGRWWNSTTTYAFNGYISGFLFVNGSGVSVGTVPTSPLTAITNTSLLLNFTNAGIYDATSKNDLETVGNAQISTAQSKFGGSSMAFDGSGDWLTAPSSPNYFLGTGDFTVECWVYLNAIPASLTYPSILEIGPNFFINFRGSGTLALTDATTLYAQSASALVTGTWYHIAVVRNSGSSRIYINGVGGTAVACTVNFPQAAASVGGGVNSTASGSPFSINGYIQDFRITKGYARYTTNFTAPTAAFPTL